MARSHYDVLGVSTRSSGDEVRKAYLDLARRFHPDRYIDASPAQRSAAERSMQEINEAWRVLGDPGRRRRYDAELNPVATLEPAGRPRTTGSPRELTEPCPSEIEHLDPTERVIRGLPWILLDRRAPRHLRVHGICGHRQSRDDAAGWRTWRGWLRDRRRRPDRAVRVVRNAGRARGRRRRSGLTQACPDQSERLQPATGPTAYCLEVHK